MHPRRPHRAPDRPAARHRGRLADARSRRSSAGSGAVTDADGASTRTDRADDDRAVRPARPSPRHDLVIDRLAYWYYHPREWLKKVALMDDVYLLNSPFTFQTMEKHAAYCAMMRLGLKVPTPCWSRTRTRSDNARYAYTAAQYNQPFDLDAIAEQVGYPLFMKPYDGGAWVGVSRIRDAPSCTGLRRVRAAADAPAGARSTGYDVFARTLSIGAETMVMKFRPEQPMHERYSVAHDFLDAATGDEVVTIGRLVNAFFRWEFNSCETLIRTARSTRSTTPTPARTSRSPACTTTSRGR